MSNLRCRERKGVDGLTREMMNEPTIAILSGGISGEREVSQRSAAAVAEALGRLHAVELIDVTGPELPAGIDPARNVVFPALHGVFGEDGEVQELLEAGGYAFAGSGSKSSRLCMNKAATKALARKHGVVSPAGLLFSADSLPDPAMVAERFGCDLVLKPNSEGSSLGLSFASGKEELAALFAALAGGEWLVEKRVRGRELTVGVLRGHAMGVVEIVPRSGLYDYESKYTKGLTEFRFPAALSAELTARLREDAETIFAVCRCRDFARVDFMLAEDGRAVFLEVNTIPGLTETSLLPKSASCEGLDFPTLAEELVRPAIERFARARKEVSR